MIDGVEEEGTGAFAPPWLVILRIIRDRVIIVTTNCKYRL